MSIQLGSTKPVSFRLGSNIVSKIMLGTDKVWPPPPSTTKFEASFNVGGADPMTVSLPIQAGTFSATVEWGDGAVDSLSTHTYNSAGNYNVSIDGTMEAFSFANDATSKEALHTISSFGDVGLTIFNCYSCIHLIGVSSPVPFPPGVTNGQWMFGNCLVLENVVVPWAGNNLTTMNGMFHQTEIISIDLTGLVTSSCTDLFNFIAWPSGYDIGEGGSLVSINASGWDTSNVTTMAQFARGRINLKTITGIETWNMQSVTSMINFAITSVLDTATYDNILIGWTGWTAGAPTKSINTLTDIPAFGGSMYTNGEAREARDYLTGTKSWNVQDGGADTGFTPLLDDYPDNVLSAIGLRKMKSSYNGNCIRVRNTQDDLAEIGFNGNELDLVALRHHVLTGTGEIVAWYDQAGNNNSFHEVGDGPIIMSGGSVKTDGTNNKASVNFINDVMGSNGTNIFSYIPGTNLYKILMVHGMVRHSEDPANTVGVITSKASGDDLSPALLINNSTPTDTMSSGYRGDGGLTGVSSFQTYNQFAFYTDWSGTPSGNIYPINERMYVGGILEASNGPLDQELGNQATSTGLGTGRVGNTGIGNMFLGELTIYSVESGGATLYDDAAGIAANTLEYYNIP